MKAFYALVLSLLLCVSVFSGCEVNINLPESVVPPQESDVSENSASSEESSSQSGVVSPGKRPFNPEISEPIHENNADPTSYENLINELYYTESAFGEAFIGYIEGPMGTGYKEFFEEQG